LTRGATLPRKSVMAPVWEKSVVERADQQANRLWQCRKNHIGAELPAARNRKRKKARFSAFARDDGFGGDSGSIVRLCEMCRRRNISSPKWGASMTGMSLGPAVRGTGRTAAAIKFGQLARTSGRYPIGRPELRGQLEMHAGNFASRPQE